MRRAARRLPVHRRRGREAGRGPVRRRADAPGAGQAAGRPGQPALPRRADQPPRHPVARRPGGRAERLPRHDRADHPRPIPHPRGGQHDHRGQRRRRPPSTRATSSTTPPSAAWTSRRAARSRGSPRRAAIEAVPPRPRESAARGGGAQATRRRRRATAAIGGRATCARRWSAPRAEPARPRRSWPRWRARWRIRPSTPIGAPSAS